MIACLRVTCERPILQSNNYKKPAKTVASPMSVEQKRVRHIEQNIYSLRIFVNNHLNLSSDEMVDDKTNAEHWTLISQNAKYISKMYLDLDNIRGLR